MHSSSSASQEKLSCALFPCQTSFNQCWTWPFLRLGQRLLQLVSRISAPVVAEEPKIAIVESHTAHPLKRKNGLLPPAVLDIISEFNMPSKEEVKENMLYVNVHIETEMAPYFDTLAMVYV